MEKYYLFIVLGTAMYQICNVAEMQYDLIFNIFI